MISYASIFSFYSGLGEAQIAFNVSAFKIFIFLSYASPNYFLSFTLCSSSFLISLARTSLSWVSSHYCAHSLLGCSPGCCRPHAAPSPRDPIPSLYLANAYSALNTISSCPFLRTNLLNILTRSNHTEPPV